MWAQTTWPRNRATAVSSLFHVASARVPATQWERVSLLLGETEAQSSAPGSGPCQVQFCCLPLQSNSRKHELVFRSQVHGTRSPREPGTGVRARIPITFSVG